MKLRLFPFLAFIFPACLLSVIVKAQHVQLLQQGTPTSIRGLSVVDDNIAWISGSKGYVALTTNAGKTWTWQQVKGYEQADFRSIEAFSDKEAVIMSSGTPALILKTIDGGISWQLKYRNADTAYFFDAMSFSNKQHGFILGDPIKNKFLLLETKNGGDTWDIFNNRPDALPEEAAFAASGTCLRFIKNDIFIVSGGPVARLFTINTKSKNWNIIPVPIAKGESSKGAFSLAKNDNTIVIVGGNYARDHIADSTSCYTVNGGKDWQLSNSFTSGFQSSVEYISGSTFLSTGTPGTNITIDGGQTWAKIDTISFNVCRKAKHGTLVLLAGNDGKTGILNP
jgi:photosystem II stability/assembly factor-like uncharacterized protein